MPLTKEWKTILTHAAVWVCFAAYEIGVSLSMGQQAPLLDFVVFYLPNIALFYFNASVGLPSAMKFTHPVLVVVPLMAAQLVVYGILTTGTDAILSFIVIHRVEVLLNSKELVKMLWRGTYFIGLSSGYFFALRSIANAQRATEMLRLKLEAERRESAMENAHLRSQINPHFLYSALGFIKNATETTSPVVARSIDLLNESMRYAMLPYQDDGRIELYREIEQIERLIQLNQIIAGNKLNVSMETDDSYFDPAYRIPPLLLLTFAENMFRHGDLKKPAAIRWYVKDGRLYFYTSNIKAAQRRSFGQHIGLVNVKARLEKFYGADFSLETWQDEINFSVFLNLKL